MIRSCSSSKMTSLHEEDGTLQGFVEILRKYTQQRQTADGSRADAELLYSMLASSGDCIKVLGRDAKLTFMSESGRRLMEVSDFNAIRGC